MEQGGPTRRLTTVLASDVVGYSKMAARDEERAVALLRRRFETATTLVQRHDGRVFNTAGDALLAEFASPVEAVRCALEIQEAMRSANLLAEEADRLQLRVGINLGDVIVNGTDLLGDGVNVAARLESLASPGGVCVSANVYEQLIGTLTLGAEDLGEQHVKNIPRPIHAYRLRPEGGPAAVTRPATGIGRLRLRVVVPVLGGLVVLGGAAVLATHWTRPPAATPAGVAQSVAERPLVPEDIPYVDDRVKEEIRTRYLPALPSKALAIADGHNLGAYVSNRIDAATAEKEALQNCAAALQRASPHPPGHVACRLYAVDNRVVWTVRPPPMPQQPWVSTNRSEPGAKVQPDKVPLISDAARQHVASSYLPGGQAKAIALGRGGTVHLVWGRASDFGAMRSVLEACGFDAERPCFIYALGDDVAVHVPETVRIVDALAADDLADVSDADRHRLGATYLPDGGWRALAKGVNGRIGLGLRQASEQQAIDQARRDCEQAGGLQCTLIAVGPFKVAGR